MRLLRAQKLVTQKRLQNEMRKGGRKCHASNRTSIYIYIYSSVIYKLIALNRQVKSRLKLDLSNGSVKELLYGSNFCIAIMTMMKTMPMMAMKEARMKGWNKFADGSARPSTLLRASLAVRHDANNATGEVAVAWHAKCKQNKKQHEKNHTSYTSLTQESNRDNNAHNYTD